MFGAEEQDPHDGKCDYRMTDGPVAADGFRRPDDDKP
jgi:hypothetical protein